MGQLRDHCAAAGDDRHDLAALGQDHVDPLLLHVRAHAGQAFVHDRPDVDRLVGVGVDRSGVDQEFLQPAPEPVGLADDRFEIALEAGAVAVHGQFGTGPYRRQRIADAMGDGRRHLADHHQVFGIDQPGLLLVDQSLAAACDPDQRSKQHDAAEQGQRPYQNLAGEQGLAQRLGLLVDLHHRRHLAVHVEQRDVLLDEVAAVVAGIAVVHATHLFAERGKAVIDRELLLPECALQLLIRIFRLSEFPDCRGPHQFACPRIDLDQHHVGQHRNVGQEFRTGRSGPLGRHLEAVRVEMRIQDLTEGQLADHAAVQDFGIGQVADELAGECGVVAQDGLADEVGQQRREAGTHHHHRHETGGGKPFQQSEPVRGLVGLARCRVGGTRQHVGRAPLWRRPCFRVRTPALEPAVQYRQLHPSMPSAGVPWPTPRVFSGGRFAAGAPPTLLRFWTKNVDPAHILLRKHGPWPPPRGPICHVEPKILATARMAHGH